MPKPTFLNLPKEKQEVLIDAAKKEFSRVPLYDASISNIIKDAGIPRGSFYQYFEDKEDVFFYLLDEESRRIHELFISILRLNNGELFDSFVDWFKAILIEFEEPQNQHYFKNAILNMNFKVEHVLTKNFYEEKLKGSLTDINQLLDLEVLTVTSEEELFHVLKIMIAVTFQNLIHVFANELPAHEAVRTFSLEMELLKRGVYKENKVES